MRDDKIYEMREQEAKRLAMIYRQVQFIESRIEAYEEALSSNLNLFKAVFNKGWLKRTVDSIQLKKLQAHDEMIKASVEKAKEQARKPKLAIVGANGISKLALIVLFVGSMSGCVSYKRYSNEKAVYYKLGHAEADAECQNLQKKYISHIDKLKERLSRFNQIDSKGDLIPLKKWTGDKEKDVKGNEPWMK